MKQLILIFFISIYTGNSCTQNNKTIIKHPNMKLNAGIITTKLAESKAFYMKNLGFGVTFENEFYLLLHTPSHEAEISFLVPNHPSQDSLFHKPFQGQGIYLTIEVDDVDKMYEVMRQKHIPIKIELRDEPWGDRHFAIEDPNGVSIDIVHHTPQTEK